MTQATAISSEEAIKIAFEQFDKLVVKTAPRSTTPPGNVLLERLELQKDDLWVVTIGFDLGRSRSSTDAGWLHISPERHEPIREFRTFEIAANDGKFKRMR
jgi:hypothetical protein